MNQNINTLEARIAMLCERETHINDPYEITPGNIVIIEGYPVKQGYFGAFKDEDESVTWALEEMMQVIHLLTEGKNNT